VPSIQTRPCIHGALPSFGGMIAAYLASFRFVRRSPPTVPALCVRDRTLFRGGDSATDRASNLTVLGLNSTLWVYSSWVSPSSSSCNKTRKKTLKPEARRSYELS